MYFFTFVYQGFKEIHHFVRFIIYGLSFAYYLTFEQLNITKLMV